MNDKKKNILIRAAAVILALAVWQAAAMSVGMEMLLASPVQVIKRLVALAAEKEFIVTAGNSLLRIIKGFLLAFAAGTLLAVLSGRFKVIEILLRPYLVTARAVPVASFIILCLIWFSFDQLTVFISLLIALPVIYSNVLQGIKSAPEEMEEMAGLYHLSWGKKLLYVYTPAIKPYLISACSVAVGMAWKAGVAAEVIGVVKDSIGGKLYEAKVYFQNADLLAWTVVIIILSVLVEKVFIFLLKRLFAMVEKI